MNFGKLIEMKLGEKGIGKKELYEQIKGTFYDSINEKYISMPAFNTRITENKISAEDMIYMAAILGIDLASIQRKASEIINSKKTKKQDVCSHIKELMKKSSSYYNTSCDVVFMSTNEMSSYKNNRFYMICMNKNTKEVSLELFDLDTLNVKTVISIVMDAESFNGISFEEFMFVDSNRKVTYLLNRKRDQDIVLGELSELNTNLAAEKKIYVPKDIIWNIEFSTNKAKCMNSTKTYTQEEIDRVQEMLSTELKKGTGFGCENKTESITIENIRIDFKIVSSNSFMDKSLHIYNKVQIESFIYIRSKNN